MTRPVQNWIKCSYFSACFIGILFFLHSGESSKDNDAFQLTGANTSNWMDKILNSLEKALEFYSSNVEKVNLDSIFGLRVGQGGLNKAITESKINRRHIIFNRLVDIHARIVELAERGFLKLKSMDSSYFKKFEHLIDGKWFAVMPYHSVDLSLVHKVTLHDEGEFDEVTSDQCMTGLIGSQLDGVKESCQISDKCWDLMTKKGADGYYLTHQGLFFLLADNRGCRARNLEKFGNDEEWQRQTKYLGANLYHQLMKTFQDKKTADDELGKDLFAEQVIVCQMLGVVQCFDSRFLSVVLELQDHSGCWKQQSQEEGNDAKEVTGIPIKFEEGDNKIVKFQGRRLQEELLLQDGCSAHFTGVATGCLGMFAYWLASHPDSLSAVGEQQQQKYSFDDPRYHQAGGNSADATGSFILVLRWFVVFAVVGCGFYYFRKFRRRAGPMLRKYKRLSSV